MKETTRDKGNSLKLFSDIGMQRFFCSLIIAIGLVLSAELAGEVKTLTAQEAESTLRGKVVGVLDGDSLEVLVDRRPVQVRLAAIDAPEWDQTRGKDAKKALSNLAFGKQVVVKTKGQDNNERTLGWVEVDGRELNAAMLEQVKARY